MSNYPLATSTWDNKELEAIQSIINSDNYTMGNHVRQFEKDFGKFINRKFCLMVNSGSTANLISIASFFYTKNPMLKKGDEVIVPAVSWSTTYFPLQQFGLKLKFVDIDMNTLNYNLDSLKSAITNNTKMLVAVNLLGNPNDFEAINKIIKNKNIFIFEDNCESLGAEYNGKYTGTFGTIGTFSTYYSHHISTIEGGLIATDNEELYHVLLSLRAHGWTRDLPKKNFVTKKSDNLFEESFRFVLPGYNVRPMEMSGAIGIEQLIKLPQLLKQRRENAKLFVSLFEKNPNYLIQKDIDKSSWFGFSLIINPDSNIKRKDVIKKLEKNKIECRPIVAGNFLRNDVMKYFNYEVHEKLRNANYIHDNGFFVGNSHRNLSKSINFLSDVLL
ncbi:aminotransferase class V-fold PLP-dependent enzyme [Candidatus Pelagibacter sp.]|nr:aminotransferase class V-fold PLP-dependent enzyme [Candidatus Pelagibacter sp.]